jgi:hypothetical protein
MTIENTYRTLLTREYILDKLRSGVPISAIDIQKEIEDLIETRDLSTSQFVASGHHVAFKESASAAKFNNTFGNIRQDLHVLYEEMIRLSQVSIESFERWNLEATSIERRLINLEDRIDDLLLLSQDTEGYHSVIIDDFVDLSLVDQVNTTAKVDLVAGEATMGENSEPGAATRIFMNDLKESDVSFRVRNVIGFNGQTDALGTSLLNPFFQESLNWWTSVHMSDITPVTCEMSITLGDEAIELTKIYMEMHDSVQSGPMIITPMYSTDNLTFSQLPSNTFTQELRTNTTFTFPQITARYIKFVMTKEGPDPDTASTGFHPYQFGFKNISFYNEGFDISVGQEMISNPLFVVGQDTLPVEFSKLVLETCERIEDGTEILYDVTVSNDPTVPVDSSTVWTRISPLNRENPNHPNIISVGDVSDITIGISETVQPSYSAFATSGVNPATSFQLLSTISGVVTDDAINGTDRYLFINPDDRILNYQIKDSAYSGTGNTKLDLDQASIIIFRNVGEKGVTPGDVAKQVRGIQKGWGFLDPYYSCTIEIQNPEGITLGDVGSSEIIIDDVPYTGTVDKNVMSGKTATQTGIHRIQVHKDNWKEVTPGAVDEAELKVFDPLYPFNQKLLIEGYSYDSAFTEDKVYNGVDVFAEMLMQEVGTFEFLYNIAQDDFKVFALDRDAAGTHTGGNESTLLFVVKVDEENPDFQNERYVIRFKLLNDLRKYLRLRATFTTEVQTVAPSLDSYKIKLG